MKEFNKVSLYWDLVVGRMMGIYQREYSEVWCTFLDTLAEEGKIVSIGDHTLKVSYRDKEYCIWHRNHPYASFHLYETGFEEHRATRETTNKFIGMVNIYIKDKNAKEALRHKEHFNI